MGVFAGIEYPEPNERSEPSEVDYLNPAPLLPLELEIFQKIMESDDNKLEQGFDLSALRVTSRQHTVVGHYTNFVDSTLEGDWNETDGTNFILSNRIWVDCILFLKSGKPYFLELVTCGNDTFASDGLIQAVEKFNPETSDIDHSHT